MRPGGTSGRPALAGRALGLPRPGRVHDAVRLLGHRAAQLLLALAHAKHVADAHDNAGGTEKQAFEVIDEKVRGNTIEVLERTKRDKILPREAAVQMARERVGNAMQYQRFNSGRRFKKPGVKPVFRAVS